MNSRPDNMTSAEEKKLKSIQLVPGNKDEQVYSMVWGCDTHTIEFSDEDEKFISPDISMQDLSLESTIAFKSTPNISLQPVPDSPSFLDQTPSLNETPPSYLNETPPVEKKMKFELFFSMLFSL